MQTLLENDARLKSTFAEIDEIERIVHHVKNTYNKVAESVDDMEKAINASISSGFPFLQVKKKRLRKVSVFIIKKKRRKRKKKKLRTKRNLNEKKKQKQKR